MNALEVLRLAVGIPAVLLLPGWAWSLALLPGRHSASDDAPADHGLGVLERAVVAFALSVALVPIAALSWSAGLGLPLGTWGSAALILLLTAAGLAVWRLRSRRR